MFLDHFDVLMLKMIFKKWKKYHFDVFQHEKHFEKLPQPHSQTDPKATSESCNQSYLFGFVSAVRPKCFEPFKKKKIKLYYFYLNLNISDKFRPKHSGITLDVPFRPIKK